MIVTVALALAVVLHNVVIFIFIVLYPVSE